MKCRAPNGGVPEVGRKQLGCVPEVGSKQLGCLSICWVLGASSGQDRTGLGGRGSALGVSPVHTLLPSL